MNFIESLVYLGLFSILIIGTLSGTTTIFESSTRNQAWARLYDEALRLEESSSATTASWTLEERTSTGAVLTHSFSITTYE
jgi:hypothetical protein